MLVEFGLAGQDALASDTLEMIALEMLIEDRRVWAIEVAAWL